MKSKLSLIIPVILSVVFVVLYHSNERLIDRQLHSFNAFYENYNKSQCDIEIQAASYKYVLDDEDPLFSRVLQLISESRIMEFSDLHSGFVKIQVRAGGTTYLAAMNKEEALSNSSVQVLLTLLSERK